MSVTGSEVKEVKTEVRSEAKHPVWEEALVEELVYLIAHLAHAEQHLLEIETELGKPILLQLINDLRTLRKEAGKTLLKVAGIEGKSSGGEFRTGAENLWCTIKHLSMALVHCDENIEKIAKKLQENPKMVEDLKILYEVRRNIREILMTLLLHIPRTIDFTNINEVRCREDLCIEEE